MTTGCVRPVRISRPPMTNGMSTRSAAIVFRRAFSSARSGEPGRYDRLKSLTGAGTRGIPEKDIGWILLGEQECRIQNAECRNKRDDRHPPLCADDDRRHYPHDRVGLGDELAHGHRITQFTLAVYAQPVARLTGYAKRDLDITKEFAFGGSSLRVLKVRTYGRTCAQQLVDERPNTRSRRQAQREAGDFASERERTISNVLG